MRIQGARQQGLVGGVGMVLGALLGGCNSFDPPASEVGPHLVIPVDERPAVTAPTRPHPVSGGTLSVLKDSSVAIVADPDRDRISIVDLASLSVRFTIPLEAGDEPGRSVEDANQHVHVALRGSGNVVTLDPLTGTVLERRAVCKSPRGLAFEAATALVHVACAEGSLVSLPAAGGAATRTLKLDPDLRDVVVQQDKLWVTRFKSAEILQVDAQGTVARRVGIPKATAQMMKEERGEKGDVISASPVDVTVSPGVAWRAVSNPAGGAVLVHQQEVDDEITISEPTASGSAYGGGEFGMPCDGIVKNTVSNVAADGTVTSTPFTGAPLAVDIALSPTTDFIAIAHAGIADFGAPRPFMVFPQDTSGFGGEAAPTPTAGPVGFGGGAVTIMSRSNLQPGACAFPEGFVQVEGPATAVAFTPTGQLLVQSQEPARLQVVRNPPFDTPITIDLTGVSLADTGHELFNRDAGGGIACASCHPEGSEDGHTWHFAGSGARRTQALTVGLRDTAPFHWAGDLADVGAVMGQVFVGRMGGVNQTPERNDALSQWLFDMQRPAPIRDSADEAAVRGKVLFESTSVGCTTCHNGPKLTNNQTVAIDSAREKLQVPSLIGIAYRSPFMHDGCATTLAARFDASCGGNQHGNVSGLSQAQIGDLVAYLETL